MSDQDQASRPTQSPQEYMRAVIESVYFQNTMLAIVVVNVIIIAVEAQMSSQRPGQMLAEASAGTKSAFQYCELTFLAIYCAEFGVKVASNYRDFWRNKYNRMDTLILVLCLVLQAASTYVPAFEQSDAWRVLLGLKSIRVFRTLTFMRSLQVVVEALINTLRNNVLDIAILLLLIMFIFGVLGHYLFGSGAKSQSDWGELGNAIRTLFIFVCADGWIPYQDRMTADGFGGSQAYTAVFIFLGNFIIANLFIGVICQNIDDATRADLDEQQAKKREARLIKRELFLRRQQSDITNLLAQQMGKGTETKFQELVKEMVGTLRHEDVVNVAHIHCNSTWLETYSITLTHRENTLYRLQQLQFGIANCLAEYVDQRLTSRVKK
ncbi:Cation channel sperm-associated protein 3 [Chytriomyces hyalinus]|nr:Cation channel sperm-associated protein 3 [Chytriomyces hyalinus]